MSLLTELDTNCIVCILCHLESCQDVLRLARVCARLHAAVFEADTAWRVLYTKTYGAAAAQAASRRGVCYRQLFQER